MVLFDMQTNYAEYIDWRGKAHKSYKGLLLPNAELYALHGGYGNMVFQSVKRPLFDIWFSNYEISQRRQTLSRADYGSVELSLLIKSNIAYNLQRPLGRVLQKQSQFNLMYTPYMENTALFEKDTCYTTLDFHAKPLLLDQLYKQYPDILGGFLNEVAAGRESLLFQRHLYASLPMLQLAEAITALLAEPVLDAFLLDTSVLLLFGFAISSQLEMASKKFRYDRKKEMEQSLQGVMAMLLADLKTFLGIQHYARMAATNPTSFKKQFQSTFGEPAHSLWRRQRMDAVFQKVVHSDMTLDAIADDFGFCDGASLSKAFKRYHKFPPSYFRKE